MMRFVQILALANALLQSDGEGHLRNAATKKEDQVSFADGMSNSFADVDAKLKAMEAKTKSELAKLQSDTAAPSSFVEKGAPDSFADLDAKLKALEEKTKSELAKLQSDTAAPSSFVQTDPESFSEIDANLKAMQARTAQQVAELTREVNGNQAPSSLLEQRVGSNLRSTEEKLKELEMNARKKMDEYFPLPSAAAANPSSFVEEGAPDSFADLDAKLKAMEEKTKAEL